MRDTGQEIRDPEHETRNSEPEIVVGASGDRDAEAARLAASARGISRSPGGILLLFLQLTVLFWYTSVKCGAEKSSFPVWSPNWQAQFGHRTGNLVTKLGHFGRNRQRASWDAWASAASAAVFLLLLLLLNREEEEGVAG